MKQLITRFTILLFLFLGGNFISHAQSADSTLILEVHFDLDSYTLSQRQKSKVDSLLDIYPIAILKHVEIYGHTDSLAGIEYNRLLSKRRVQSILAYLVYHGLDPLKVKADYYGEERPKYDNAPETRARNRRCEVHFQIDPSMLPQPELRLTDLEFKKGNKIRIPNLNFVGNQPIPVGKSFESLGDLLRVMQKYPDLKIELQGHVCCSDDQVLSEARAQMVYDFLVGNGIDPSRMTHQGFSNSQPLFKERTDKEKALNRRVEVLVVSNSDRVAPVPEGEPKIDLRAPVMSVRFFPNKRRLMPAGDFMMILIAEMMKESTGLYFEFVIFDNINNRKLTSIRAAGLARVLMDKGVNASKFKVTDMTKPARMPEADDDNFIMLKISKK